MKILLIAPGATHSTHDCFKYYLDAMRENEDIHAVEPFNYHNVILYHIAAVNTYFPHYSQDDREAVASTRAARELLLDVIEKKPDVVFFIAGGMIPIEVYRELRMLRDELNRKFAIVIYLTECPYMDKIQKVFGEYGDVLFLNDKYSLDFFDPSRTHYIDYLPHSYNPKVHNTGIVDKAKYEQSYASDVFFGGTAFRERVEMLGSLKWGQIDLRLTGNWQEWADESFGMSLQKFVVPNSSNVSNSDFAKYYRNTKIALNVHRTRLDINGDSPALDNHSDAYSIGPRVYEAAACGAFILTDYRQEAKDLFGDTIEFFDTHDELQAKLEYWLDPQHEQERLNKAQAANQKVKPCTFHNRLSNNIVPVLKEVLTLRRN